MQAENRELSVTEQARLAYTKTPDERGEVPAGPQPSPDGYVRQTPVQAIKIARGYRQRIARRVAGVIIAVVVVAVLAYLLLPRLLV
jgi:hypothetical protein